MGLVTNCDQGIPPFPFLAIKYIFLVSDRMFCFAPGHRLSAVPIITTPRITALDVPNEFRVIVCK